MSIRCDILIQQLRLIVFYGDSKSHPSLTPAAKPPPLPIARRILRQRNKIHPHSLTRPSSNNNRNPLRTALHLIFWYLRIFTPVPDFSFSIYFDQIQCNTTMTYDPTDIYAAEPKLLSLSCFPTSLFSVVQPPNYDLIMASARYHRVPEEENRGRVSLDSSIGDNNVDSELLLSDPMRTSDHHDPPAKQHKFSFHPTLLSRSLAVAVFIMSCILLGSSRRNRNIFALVILSLAIIRNVIVIIHHLFSRKIRIRIEYRNQRLGFPKSDLKIPGWLKTTAHILVDILLVVLLIIAGIIATQGSKGWYYWRDPWTSLAYPGCVLLHIGK